MSTCVPHQPGFCQDNQLGHVKDIGRERPNSSLPCTPTQAEINIYLSGDSKVHFNKTALASADYKGPSDQRQSRRRRHPVLISSLKQTTGRPSGPVMQFGVRKEVWVVILANNRGILVGLATEKEIIIPRVALQGYTRLQSASLPFCTTCVSGYKFSVNSAHISL